MGEYKILNFSDFGDFKNKNYENGVMTLTLASWSEFHDVVKIFKNNKDYIWRGQIDKKEWILNSKFDREFSKEDRKTKLNRMLSTFKKRLKDLPNTHNLDFSKDFEILAIGQHHGLPTPLLDWTESPYIAAYFAFYEKSTENRIIYALNRAVKRLMVIEKNVKTKNILSRNRKIEFDFDSSHFSWEHHNRLKAQRGAFTKSYKGNDIKPIVKEFWKEMNKKNVEYKQKIIFAEFSVSNNFRDECLEFLESMNITHGVLFPDYAGAVDICKIDLGLDKCCVAHTTPSYLL